MHRVGREGDLTRERVYVSISKIVIGGKLCERPEFIGASGASDRSPRQCSNTRSLSLGGENIRTQRERLERRTGIGGLRGDSVNNPRSGGSLGQRQKARASISSVAAGVAGRCSGSRHVFANSEGLIVLVFTD